MKFSRETMDRLTPEERYELMAIQMSRSGRSGGYLPDDCSECGACGQPMLGIGLCRGCSGRYQELVNKAMGRANG